MSSAAVAGRQAAGVTIELSGSDSPQVVVVGLSEELLAALRAGQFDRRRWSRILAVRVAAEGPTPLPPMLGSHAIRNDRLVFTSRFPLKPGLAYRARFDPRSLATASSAVTDPIEATLRVPPLPAVAPSFVTAVYPSRTVLPENQLKFYIHFSAPMRRGGSYRHVRLLDDSSRPVDVPFLELGEELWDASGRRFTLFFDPGRIKRGLRPREELGTSLVAGRDYTLVVSDQWKDARGNSLRETFRKTFHVTSPDMTQPSSQRWRLTTPLAHTREPLVVVFDEPLDHAMLGRVLRVKSLTGDRLPGTVTIDKQETHWSFQPTIDWQPGDYELDVDTTLEDLAGNSLGQAFEVSPTAARIDAADLETIPFRVSAVRP